MKLIGSVTDCCSVTTETRTSSTCTSASSQRGGVQLVARGAWTPPGHELHWPGGAACPETVVSNTFCSAQINRHDTRRACSPPALLRPPLCLQPTPALHMAYNDTITTVPDGVVFQGSCEIIVRRAMEQLDMVFRDHPSEMQDVVYIGCCNNLAHCWEDLETIRRVLRNPQTSYTLRRAARCRRREIFRDALELYHAGCALTRTEVQPLALKRQKSLWNGHGSL